MKRWYVSRCVAIAVILLAAAVATANPLTVTAPADGEVLRGGSVARIAWTAVTPLPRGVVEWEAFLSVDGGRYYAARVTPHLDIDIRSFEWVVPNVSSNDVRLLIRVGDEREEQSFDVPLRLSIVADPFVRAPAPAARGATERGESARPGDPAVAEWAAGDRNGRLVVYKRSPSTATWRSTSCIPSHARHARARASGIPPPQPAPALASITIAIPVWRASSPLLAHDILLLVRRRNI